MVAHIFSVLLLAKRALLPAVYPGRWPLLTPVLATWTIRSENELIKIRLPILRFSLLMTLRQDTIGR
jgi:hypothetical protein